jgi:hypothetical protein
MENSDFEIHTLLQSTGYKRDDIRGTFNFDNDFPIVENGVIEAAIWPDVWNQPRSIRRRHNSAPSKDEEADGKKLAFRIKSTNNLYWKECCHRSSFDAVESDRSRSSSESEKTDEETTVVKCPTFGTEYTAEGLRRNEMPVVGKLNSHFPDFVMPN